MSVDKSNVVRIGSVPGSSSDRPWLDDLVTPPWLLSDIYGDSWTVTKSNSASSKTKNINFKVILPDGTWLTDPVNSHLLETAQIFIYWARMDVDPITHSGDTQYKMYWVFFNFISWMRLSGYRRLSDLIPEDFDTYKESLAGGNAVLLDLERRLDAYIQEKRAKGEPFPTYDSGKRLSQKKIWEEIGVHFGTSQQISVCTYGLAVLSQEEGCYLKPSQIKLIEAGFDDEPEEEDIIKTYGALGSDLGQIANLWRYEDKFSDFFTFDPFLKNTPLKMARAMFENGVIRSARTGTIPIPQAAEIIDRALRWVLDYGDDLLRLRDIYENKVVPGVGANVTEPTWRSTALIRDFKREFEAFEPEHQGPAQPWPVTGHLTTDNDRDGLELFRAVNRFLPVACAIVIAFFAARRHVEVLSIRARTGSNAYALQFDENGLWLECWIEKIVQDWDRVPVPSSVKMAVRLLRRWSYPARRLTGRAELFQCKALGSDKIVEFNLGQSLKEFAEYVDIAPLKDGTKWVFKPHQFRRFFSVLFYWRWDLGRGDLSALGWHLRHISRNMTKRYVHECKAGQAFNENHNQNDFDLFASVRDGERNIAGKAGERFKETLEKLVEQCRKNVEVVTPQIINRRIARFIRRAKKPTVPLPWGYCVAEVDETKPIKGALCHDAEPETNLPDLENATPLLCAECPRFMSSSTMMGYWEGLAETEESVARNEKNPLMMRQASEQRAAEVRVCIDNFSNSKQVEIFDEAIGEN